MATTYLLSPATAADVPGMVQVWFTAFNSPGMLSVFPDTAVGHAYAASSLLKGVEDPSLNIVQYVMTVVDPAEPEKRGRIVAYARWMVLPAGPGVPSWRIRWEQELGEGMKDEILSEAFFDPMTRQHVTAMGDRAHYFLEVLATHEDFRKQGLGSTLLKWGSEQADRDGLECYLDAEPSAKGLYEKHGYEQQPWAQDAKSHALPMKRGITKAAALEKTAAAVPVAL